MKRINLKSIVLLILIITIISFGLTGCMDTGTVRIIIKNDYNRYTIYMDGDDYSGLRLGTTDYNGTGIFDYIPIGFHSFYAVRTDFSRDGWAHKTIYIGNNDIEIYTFSKKSVDIH
jgi:hypothetical protein